MALTANDAFLVKTYLVSILASLVLAILLSAVT